MNPLTEYLSAHLDRELAITRRLLPRVPEGQADWRPHPKSMALGYLGTLVATMPAWIAMTITRDELDINPQDGKGFAPEPWKTNADLVKQFEQCAAQAKEALAGTDDAFLATPWKLLAGGQIADERPRREVIGDTLCHAAHHRGQMSVYLRILDREIPSIYGPSADDRPF